MGSYYYDDDDDDHFNGYKLQREIGAWEECLILSLN